MACDRPNILLLFTDQQRYDTIAALGNDLIKTPALDRLCREGIAFTRCYTPSPVCAPARAAVASGLPPHVGGLTDNEGADAYRPGVSFMQRLASVGYQTHGVGKMHFVPNRHNLWGFDTRDTSEEGIGKGDDYVAFLKDNGFDHVDEPHGVRSEHYYIPQPSQLPDRLHHTRWVADRSIDFLNRRDQSRPFFLWSSWIKPHPPFEAPTPWNKLYRIHDMPEPFRPKDGEDLLTYWNRVQNRYKYRDGGYDPLFIRTMRAMYYACISYIDSQLARVLDALGDDIDNTLIVFTADHGELLGDYHSVGKRCMLDASAKVPMLVRYPKAFAPGTTCDTPTTLLDLFPTFLRAAGIDESMPSDEGMDLARLVAAPEASPADRTVYSQFQDRGYGLYMAADSIGKYIYSEADQRDWYIDTANDPAETRNVPDHPHAAVLKQRLIARFVRDGYTEPLNDDHTGWRTYPVRRLPDDDPDFGLLYQDPKGTQDRVDALGEYARQVTVPSDIACRLLRPRR